MTQENELYVLHRNGKIDWDSEQVCSNVPGDTLDDSYEWVLFAAAPVVALGGEKGEAVAWRYSRNNGKSWHLAEQDPTELMPDSGGIVIPLFAAPAGKARMLAGEERRDEMDINAFTDLQEDLRREYDKARSKAAAEARKQRQEAFAAEIEAMVLRDMRKRASDLSDSDESASSLLQHSSVALTKRHYRTKATQLKPVR